MKTPVQTTQNFELSATAAITLSTLRLRSINWMLKKTDQNPGLSFARMCRAFGSASTAR